LDCTELAVVKFHRSFKGRRGTVGDNQLAVKIIFIRSPYDPAVKIVSIARRLHYDPAVKIIVVIRIRLYMLTQL
jgi:hypothetical protein